jgi:hypothetical protein
MSERAEYWQRLLGVWERSGLSQAEFCRRRGIKAVTLAWWKRRLRTPRDTERQRRGRRVDRRRRARFVEVALPHGASLALASRGSSLAPTSNRYELVLPSGACLRLPGDFDPERVAQLVQALAAAC